MKIAKLTIGMAIASLVMAAIPYSTRINVYGNNEAYNALGAFSAETY